MFEGLLLSAIGGHSGGVGKGFVEGLAFSWAEMNVENTDKWSYKKRGHSRWQKLQSKISPSVFFLFQVEMESQESSH